MKVFTTNSRLPIKSWCDNPEESAIEQAENLANLPFAFKQIVLCPDVHKGFGMPIGGVLATSNVIIPNAVGVDVGCGVCALKTNIQDYNTDLLKKIIGEIRQVVPVGFNKHRTKQDGCHIPSFNSKISYPVIQTEVDNALFSVGTLGGGNHFIELQKDKENFLWVMIHSGSRNLGKKVADHYNKKAIEINEKYFSAVPKEYELAFLPIASQEGWDYDSEMQYCIEFALCNRKLMMENVKKVLLDNLSGIKFDDIINIAHNYARKENHFGQNVTVHRKGATSARLGEVGIIPGSQGTKSYIVKGKGNKESFESCSHGAGRKMGRKQAQRTLNLEQEQKLLNDLGVIHAVRNTDDLDESPGSYKDIDTVMAEQRDLVDVLVELSPLGVIKG